MKSNFEKIKEFHRAFLVKSADTPTLRDEDTEALRIDLIKEEVQELIDALHDRDLTEVADALGDILYVVYGMADVYGINIDAVFDEIHRSNMSKLDDNGVPILREDGKILKGANYTPPNILKVLGLDLDE